MQPYFFPYIGYFQLINAVDTFIIYDNIKYTKKGWINRNRILLNGREELISLPIKKDSDYLHIFERNIAESWKINRVKMLNKIREAYRAAPYFDTVFPLIKELIIYPENNLFLFINNAICNINKFLGIYTPIIKSSTLPINHSLKSESKVIEICKSIKAKEYINPIGGVELYNKEKFKAEGIDLKFIESNNIDYKQFDNKFIESLSIIDLMMFNPKDEIKKYLESYNLV